jgi:archaellum biogenesis protein FlaJ (TadC family)
MQAGLVSAALLVCLALLLVLATGIQTTAMTLLLCLLVATAIHGPIQTCILKELPLELNA